MFWPLVVNKWYNCFVEKRGYRPAKSAPMTIRIGEKMRPALQQLEGRKNLVGVEIGVALGNNARRILNQFDVATLYLVDPFTQYIDNNQIFDASGGLKKSFDKLKKFQEKTRLVWMTITSLEAAKLIDDGSLDFAYIDGNHEYEFARADLRAWWPKVKGGGLLAGHDYGNSDAPGVKKAVDEMFPSPHRLNTYAPNDWWIFKK